MKNRYSLKRKQIINAKTLLLAFLLSMFAGSTNVLAQNIQIGTTGGSPFVIPINYYYEYSYSQVIYTAAEMAAQSAPAPGYINKIRFLPNASYPTTEWQDWTIYIGNTSQVGFIDETNFIPVASMTQVFSGLIPANTVGGTWMEITLSTPFLWDGTSNIVVAVDENSANY